MLKNQPLQRATTTTVADADANSPMNASMSGITSTASVKSSREAPAVILPKLMQMYASRACRTAIMIGTALSTTHMQKIVSQLSAVQHPWQVSAMSFVRCIDRCPMISLYSDCLFTLSALTPHSPSTPIPTCQCPHGRPTMRHMADLTQLLRAREIGPHSA